MARAKQQLAGLTEDLADLVSKGPAVVSAIVALVRKAYPYLGTIRKIVEDPALPAVMSRIQTINSFPTTAPLFATPGVPITAQAAGVGLNKLIMPLDVYITIRQNPWIPWAVGAGIILVIGGAGYRLGKRKAQRT